MNMYHGENKFLVLGGQVKSTITEKYGYPLYPYEELVIGFEPNYSTFMNLYVISSEKLQKVGSI